MRIHRFLPLLLLAAACESDPLATAALNLEVSAELGDSPPPLFTFEVWNRGRETVYLAACDARILPVVQRRVDGGWEDTSSTFCLGTVSADPVALTPGARAQGPAPVPGTGEYRVAVVVREAGSADAFRVVASDPITVGP